MIHIVYFGTSQPSAQVLETLATTEGFHVAAVITQPSKPVGRNLMVTPSPVKVTAERLEIKVLEPETLKNFDLNNEQLAINSIDLFLVFAYGLIIPQAILDIPTYGSINIHPSLLPKYRGPTPIQSALLNGETETGVSIMLLDAKMDHGPILAQTKMTIDPDDTTPVLTEKLLADATPLLLKIIPDYVDGKMKPTEQNHDAATICTMLSRDDGKIDWNKSAQEIYNMYRAFTPWPGIWTTWNGKRLKLLKIKKCDYRENNLTIQQFNNSSGKVIVLNNKIIVRCYAGSIEIDELQLEGKKPMDAHTFINGYKNFDTVVLGK